MFTIVDIAKLTGQTTKEDKLMKIDDLIKLYEEKRKIYGVNTHQHISELLTEAKKIHHRDWLKNPTLNRDHDQTWRAFKGKNFEKLVLYIIKKEVEGL